MTTHTYLHAHVERSSQDCDGPTEDTYVRTIEPREAADKYGDLAFRDRVLVAEVCIYAVTSGTLKVTEAGFTWHEATEEGHRSAEVRWCEDASCDTGARGHRDVYAENMGY